ncbi:MAG: isoamylase early set domain-containing protein [Chitinophagales bacterium]|nr:isoamylase early set domain-containing protein [Chitinophagales bacterium]
MSIVKKYQATKGNYKVTFSYPATEGIKEVQVLGDFNNWNSNEAPKLKKVKGDFTASVELNAGNSYEFKYLVNGSVWENDQQADQLVPGFYGALNGVVSLDAVEKKAKATTATKKETVAKTPAVAKATKTTTAKATKTTEAKPKVAKAAGDKKVKLGPTVKTVKVVATKRTKKPIVKPSDK